MILKDKEGNICYGLTITEEMLSDPKEVLLFLKANPLCKGKLLKTSEVFLVHNEVESVSHERLIFDQTEKVTIITKHDTFILGEGYSDCVKNFEDYEILE